MDKRSPTYANFRITLFYPQFHIIFPQFSFRILPTAHFYCTVEVLLTEMVVEERSRGQQLSQRTCLWVWCLR